ncbi:MAG: TetR/AcrR family transcriptional regulator [Pseudomonadota bacterium]
MTDRPQGRARYLEIATERFAEQGFHGLSLAALAKAAGVTKQALLHHFGTKERLYAEVLEALATRLTAALEAAEGPTPAARLTAYFDAMAQEALARPQDARLVVRALLESDADAKVWPLKRYLAALATLARQTPPWRAATEAEALAGIYGLIGAVQYAAISAAALEGMYGAEARDAIAGRAAKQARAAVRVFAGED